MAYGIKGDNFNLIESELGVTPHQSLANLPKRMHRQCFYAGAYTAAALLIPWKSMAQQTS